MKKALVLILTLALALTALVGCGKKADDAAADAPADTAAATEAADATEETKVIKVGATPAPHAQILEVAKEVLAKEGYELEIVEYNDYVLPNTATEDGELDANYFQHGPYLENFNEENGTHLVSVAALHYEPMSIYAGKTASLDELKDGATIAIPNDGTNEARALKLLEAEGLITLKEDADFTATVLDIKDNPHNFQIQEIEAAQIPRTLADVDIAVINGNYAIGAGLDTELVLASESADSEAAQTYANVLVVKEGNEDNDAIKALVKALESDEVRTFIEETYDGTVVALF